MDQGSFERGKQIRVADVSLQTKRRNDKYSDADETGILFPSSVFLRVENET